MSLMFIVTVLVLFIFAIVGLKRGLMKSVVSLVVLLVALFLASVGHTYVSKAICDYTNIDEKLQEKISEQLELNLANQLNSTTDQITAIEAMDLPESLKKTLIDNNNQDAYKELDVNGFVDYVTALLSHIVINALGYLACFVILLIFFAVLASMTKLLTDLPIIGGINSLGGLVLGLLKGVLAVWVMYIVITLAISTELGSDLYAQIQENQLTLFLYENNLLMDVLLNVSKLLF